MNVFQKATLRVLKMNPARTVATIIGVVLSAAMICAVTTFTASFRNYLLEVAIYSDGDWHGEAENVDYAKYADILTDPKVENAIRMDYIGYAHIRNSNEWKPYLFIAGLSDGAQNVLPIHIVDGTYPANSGEILLPLHLIENSEGQYSIGGTLTLNIGSRILDGYEMIRNQPCYNRQYEGGQSITVHNGETLTVRETRTYTVVGFYERFSYDIEEYSAAGYTALTVADTIPANRCDVYFKMKNGADVYSFAEENNISGEFNTDVLAFSGVSHYNAFEEVLYSVSVVVIVLIMLGSISLIYNAFSISVSERTRQFGLLSSIGATRKQLRGMVLFEALCVSVIGIPIGIVAGTAGIGVTLLLIGDRFTSLGVLVPMQVCISLPAMGIAAAVALITVLLSAWIPAVRAAKVSAVEAIRQSRDIRTKKKSSKTAKVTYALFGLPGVLARKHYKRSRKKYRSTVLSLFMSIVLFVSAAAFTDYLISAVTDGFSSPEYDLIYYIPYSQRMEDSHADLLDTFASAKSVTDVAYANSIYTHVDIPSDQLSEQYKNFISERTAAAPEGDLGKNTENFRFYIVFVDDESFADFLAENGLDAAKFTDPENPRAVAIDSIRGFDAARGQILSLRILNTDQFELTFRRERLIEGYYSNGEERDEHGNLFVSYYTFIDGERSAITLPSEEAMEDFTLSAGAVLANRPYYVLNDTLTFIYPASMHSTIYPSASLANGASYYFKSDDHAESYDDIRKLLTVRGISDSQLYDHAESVEEERNLVMIIRVFAYGFTVLISLIAAVNVFNTISTNIILRRREFAMLKSVGMTKGGFDRMMCYECLLYGSRALLYGLPAALGTSYLIYRAFGSGYDFAFQPPWGAMVISCLSVFIVVFITMLYAMHKVKRENPIDALKNENL
ncbi:MAG: ABC transporter permease [Clostridiales bacterium]|nr:ABC transporter permease [Clostridiales bacterium]